ncbi:MAG TPA: class I adenylate-forming enzyme family protein, partial [Chthoniobacterales bacterium]|nr:class I adenylate-forming enzyme family protein [Chthoniobacterales bacterium]
METSAELSRAQLLAQAMKSLDPLLAEWDKILTRKGNAAAILATNGEVLRTFREVEETVRGFADKIDMFHAGEVVAIQIGNHEDWPAIMLACLRKQLVVLPLERSISERERDAALEICGVSAVVAAVPGDKSPEVLRLGTAASTPEGNWGEKTPSLLKLTSGTTAAPRAIRFRSEQLLADCDQICQTMGISDIDLNFGVIPVSHSYGFSNLLTPLIARGVSMVLSRDRLPRAVLVDLARTNATVFPGMPLFYQAFGEMEEIPALPKLRLCISAGAPLSATVARKFREKFKQPIHSFYGSSECGGICYDRGGTIFEDGFVGTAMENVDLEIVDAKAVASQVRVRSAAVGEGYFPEPDMEKLRDGVFVPDDLLARHGSGFKIAGRISDLINVAGKKVNPAEVEAHLLRFAGVREAVVFGCPSLLRNEEVAACVVADADLIEANLLEFCRAELSAWQVPKRIFLVDEIPVN